MWSVDAKARKAINEPLRKNIGKIVIQHVEFGTDRVRPVMFGPAEKLGNGLFKR